MIRRIRWWLWVAGAPIRFTEISLIRLYRVTLSGLLGGQCRFHPTCSVYAEQSIRSLGAVRGSAFAAWRILRCSPLSRGGIDRPPARALVYDADIHQAWPSPSGGPEEVSA